MEKTKEAVSKICDLKEKFMSAACEEMGKGVQNVNTHEMGEVIDMIKDLAEAEEKCWKAMYYKQIVEAMEEASEEEELMAKMGMFSQNDRMGFDNWRYASGRFAPKGHGHRSGYRPSEDLDDPWMMAEGFGDMDRKGYNGGRSGGSSSGSSNNSMSSSGQNGRSSGPNNDRMGYSGPYRGERYERWHQARMGYHSTKDASEKQHMDASARDYVVDVAESMKEIWRDADPGLRKEIKSKLVALTGEMN